MEIKLLHATKVKGKHEGSTSTFFLTIALKLRILSAFLALYLPVVGWHRGGLTLLSVLQCINNRWWVPFASLPVQQPAVVMAPQQFITLLGGRRNFFYYYYYSNFLSHFC